LTSLRIEPLPGFAPTIGRLVSMLAYSRVTLLAAVEGLSRTELDHLHDAQSNSIGALLAHVAAVERWYQVLTFEDHELSADETAPWSAALDLGDEGRRQLKGRELQSYLDTLAETRGATLATSSGATVDPASTMSPGVSACAAPSGPNRTASICRVSTTRTMMTSQARASAAGEGWHVAPRRAASASASGRMSRTWVANRPRNRLRTTPMPIAPAPMTPTANGVFFLGMAGYFAGGGNIAYGSQSFSTVAWPSTMKVSSAPRPRNSIDPLL